MPKTCLVGADMFKNFKNYSGFYNESLRLSLMEIDNLTVDIEDNKYIFSSKLKKEEIVKMSDVYKLYILENERQQEVLSRERVYRPDLSYKLESSRSGYIVVYNLNIFLDEYGDLVIPEGVSVISCNHLIECRHIRFPKSLSCILNLNIKCDGICNLRNVRFIENLSVDAKELILPYTLERISDNGLKLFGKTIVRSERTLLGDKVRVGSLGEYSIIDFRVKKTPIYLSNRFYNLFENSLCDGVTFFKELELCDCELIDSIFIKKYYPDFLYKTLDDMNKFSFI